MTPKARHGAIQGGRKSGRVFAVRAFTLALGLFFALVLGLLLPGNIFVSPAPAQPDKPAVLLAPAPLVLASAESSVPPVPPVPPAPTGDPAPATPASSAEPDSPAPLPADSSAPASESVSDSASESASGPAPAAAPVAAKKSKSTSIRLFGSVEFRGTLKGVPSWTNMLERNKKKPLLVAGAKLNSSTMWDDFKVKLEAMSPMERLKAVNRFWNQWPYRLDPEVYGKPDYWATPEEFRRKSGDCEDYSIAKYYTLKEVGISPDDMRVVVLMETIRNIAHAVLVVYLDGDAWILDNLSNSVLAHSRYKNYIPQFSVNEKFRWAHIRPK